MKILDIINEARNPSGKTAQKISFIQSKFDAGEVTDPKTVDYIYKILQKPEIQQAVSMHLGDLVSIDRDVAMFQKNNNEMLVDVIRKLPVPKEKLDTFIKRWSKGKGFVNVEMLKSGTRGTLQQLIPDPTAFVAFEKFEQLKSQVRLHKKGTAGYGEFGLAMLSPSVTLKAPGDIEVDGTPIEVKGNDARLYADERSTSMGEMAVSKGTPLTAQPGAMDNEPEDAEWDQPEADDQEVDQPTKVVAPKKVKVAKPAKPVSSRGTAPGALNNVLAGILNNDQHTINQAIQAFTHRGVKDPAKIISAVQKQGDAGLELLQKEWWKAGFTAYQHAIQMPIMVIGFGQFLISDKANDFVKWGCLPRSITNYGYMFGRQAGQSRETYPKIFVPGHNK
jgi:hypothetical protein